MRYSGWYLFKLFGIGFFAVLIGGVLCYFTARHPVRMDVTKQQSWKLSKARSTYLNTINTPIHLVFFTNPLADPSSIHNRSNRTTVKTVLEEIAENHPKIHLHHYSVMDQPRKIDRFESFSNTSRKSIRKQEPLFIIRGTLPTDPDEQKPFPKFPPEQFPRDKIRDWIEKYPLEILARKGRPTTEGTVELQPETVERLLFQSFIRLTRTEDPEILLLQPSSKSPKQQNGNRYTYSNLNKLITQYLGYELQSRHRSNDGWNIPSSTDVLLIPRLNRSLSKAEQSRINEYLSRGGALVLFCSPDRKRALNPILNSHGIKIPDRTIQHSRNTVRRFAGAMKLDSWNRNHPMTRPLFSGNTFMVVNKINPVLPSSTKPERQSTSTLLKTGSNKQPSNSNPSNDAPPSSKRKGSVAMASDRGDSRVVVFGANRPFSDNVLQNPSRGNGAYWFFLNAMRWSSGFERELDVISPRDVQSPAIIVTKEEGTKLFRLLVFTFPGLFLVIGLSIWWFRKLYYQS